MPRKEKAPPCIITMGTDNHTRLVVRESATIDEALRLNPHSDYDDRYVWSRLVRAKWAIANNETCLLSRQH